MHKYLFGMRRYALVPLVPYDEENENEEEEEEVTSVVGTEVLAVAERLGIRTDGSDAEYIQRFREWTDPMIMDYRLVFPRWQGGRSATNSIGCLFAKRQGAECIWKVEWRDQGLRFNYEYMLVQGPYSF